MRWFRRSRPGPALAPHPRPLSGDRLGVHAAADPGLAGRELLRTVPRALSRLSRPSRARHPPPFGRAGRDWATIGARPTCTGWRRRSCASRAASCPAIRPSCEMLPGVGRYTAGAVASFACERPTPAVDTNVARVIRRAFHPRLPPERGRAPSLGDRQRASCPRRGGRPGFSIRRSWSWARWCCTARVARCGGVPGADRRARPDGGGLRSSRRAASIAPANSATSPKVPEIDATIFCRERSSSK